MNGLNTMTDSVDEGPFGGKLLTRVEAAQYITDKFNVPCNHRQLEVLAHRRKGPTYTRFGKAALYTKEDLDAWASTAIKRIVHPE